MVFEQSAWKGERLLDSLFLFAVTSLKSTLRVAVAPKEGNSLAVERSAKLLRFVETKLIGAKLTSLKHSTARAPHCPPSLRFFRTSKMFNTAEGVFIHETKPTCLADIRINKRWLQQHKQSVDARYCCSTKFRSYFLQCRQFVQQP
jgi:hypothetical protein